jgi:O-antigen ligase
VSISHAQQERLGVWVDRGLALLLALVLALTCLCLGGVRAETRLCTHSAVAVLLVLQLLRSALLPGAAPLRLPRAAGWLTGAFLLLGLFHSLGLSPVPWLAFGEFLDWCQLAAIAWLVGCRTPPGWPRLILAAGLATSALACVGLGLYQVLSDPRWLPLGRQQVSTFLGRASGGFGAPNSLAGLVLLVLPPCLFLALRRLHAPWLRVLGAYLSLCLLAGLLLTQSRGAWLAFALMLLSWPLFFWRGAGLRRLSGTCLVFCLLALGAAALYQHSERTRGRLDSLAADGGERSRPVLWLAALSEFRAHPLLGGGAGAFPAAFEAVRPESLQADPVRPHNEYLDTLSSLGLVGFLLGGAALLAFAWPGLFGTAVGGRLFPGLGLGLLAFCLHLFLEFHLRIPALAMAFAIILGLDRAEGQAWSVAGQRRPWSILLLAATLASTFGLLVLPRLRAEALRQPAREAFEHLGAQVDPVRLSLCEDALRQSLKLWPGQAQAHADLSAVLAARWTPAAPQLARESEAHARLALALSDTAWEFWARLGVALDLQGRWVEAGPCFTEALARAPVRTETRYFLAWHFSLRRTTFENARGMVEACLLLDPFHPQAQALRMQLEGQVALPTRSP